MTDESTPRTTVPEAWERCEVPWSPEAYRKKGAHRQVWTIGGAWVGHWGGFLLSGRFPTAAAAISTIDKLDADMPGPGEVWHAESAR